MVSLLSLELIQRLSGGSGRVMRGTPQLALGSSDLW